jgi:hypothetical protein
MSFKIQNLGVGTSKGGWVVDTIPKLFSLIQLVKRETILIRKVKILASNRE